MQGYLDSSIKDLVLHLQSMKIQDSIFNRRILKPGLAPLCLVCFSEISVTALWLLDWKRQEKTPGKQVVFQTEVRDEK